ncbi:MAG: hypothetical protein E6J71_24570 [Deltaproteobacteria bacterium]|nr:MAG: hypothetical protein E6J81_10645 [Deltaproteobacteria bacterium]TMB12119.1 MAG: hypothetical protein E6J71_24570 [Deltaproteobacteria bacterium]
MDVLVDLRAVRPGRLAETLATEDLTEHVRDFRVYLRGAEREPLPDGIRLRLRLELGAIAALADLVRAEADTLPFFAFRLLADPPECWLEVTGTGRAAEMARAMFGELPT